MKHSPHLPPPACYVPTHYRMQSLQRVLFYVFLGMLSGMTAAFMAVAWFVPTIVSVQPLQSAFDRTKKTAETPTPQLMQQTRQRLVTLYASDDKIGTGLYRAGAARGNAILVSSDGWAVAYDPERLLGDGTGLEAIDYQGVIHRVNKGVRSSSSGVLYLSLDGAGFRIMPVASWDTISPDNQIWALLQSEWSPGTIAQPVISASGSDVGVLLASPWYRILSETEKRSILLSTQGEFIGFASPERTIVPGWLIDREVASLLDRGTIQYAIMPWRGEWVSRIADRDGTTEMTGWYIANAGTKNGMVKAGDTVVRLRGRPIDPATFSRDILSLPSEFELSVVRNGKELTLTASKSL